MPARALCLLFRRAGDADRVLCRACRVLHPYARPPRVDRTRLPDQRRSRRLSCWRRVEVVGRSDVLLRRHCGRVGRWRCRKLDRASASGELQRGALALPVALLRRLEYRSVGAARWHCRLRRRFEALTPLRFVMPGFAPGIHEFQNHSRCNTWMARTSPAMTRSFWEGRGLRLELGVPVEIVEPALMQVIRRELPPVAMQLEHRWPVGLLCGKHLGLVRQLAALEQIARRASGNHVVDRKSTRLNS